MAVYDENIRHWRSSVHSYHAQVSLRRAAASTCPLSAAGRLPQGIRSGGSIIHHARGTAEVKKALCGKQVS
ncbi:hypothetical protein DSM101010T_10090 [Desulfovibrio subterraneus]|uniref:Uncharacterized protein n=1 Tax=Desulfovibrio subterraneus TaxID=2718620 RepID=A0A7J0BHT1_9BACT|nr:hypothetical protein DSM101010T_10090 [Desulfovibrio subterraneus]